MNKITGQDRKMHNHETLHLSIHVKMSITNFWSTSTERQKHLTCKIKSDVKTVTCFFALACLFKDGL